MENKETLFKTNMSTTLAYDEEYFKHIFKKTEKIACAVFFITRSDRDMRMDDTVIVDVEKTTQELMDVSFRALRATDGSRRIRLEEVGYMLVELESKLRLLNAARMLPDDLLAVFVQEIDSVQRTLKRYTKPDLTNPLLGINLPRAETQTMRRTQRVVGEYRGASTGTPNTVQTANRRERVLTVLKDVGEATIKDISERITDCSEKTIQRELISLIKDGLIVREGERRWSKYKLL